MAERRGVGVISPPAMALRHILPVTFPLLLATARQCALAAVYECTLAAADQRLLATINPRPLEAAHQRQLAAVNQYLFGGR